MTACMLLCALVVLHAQSISKEFVFVEGGTFRMGSNVKDDFGAAPVHNVTLSSFFMCVHEVTQMEYQSVMGENPSFFTGGSQPVDCVTWYNAVEYCNKRSVAEGFTPCYKKKADGTYTCDFASDGYRLPTEAEWEYAAKGGKKNAASNYSGGNDIDEVAWHYDNSDDQTHEVMTKESNALGLYDMSGNVHEWCWDGYAAYTAESQTNPTGALNADNYVVRGGSCFSSALGCRVAMRVSLSPTDSDHVGFRVVRTRLTPLVAKTPLKAVKSKSVQGFDKSKYKEVSLQEADKTVAASVAKGTQSELYNTVFFKSKCHLIENGEIFFNVFADCTNMVGIWLCEEMQNSTVPLFAPLIIYYHYYDSTQPDSPGIMLDGWEIVDQERFVGQSYFAADNLKIRSAPSLNAEKVGVLYIDNAATVLEVGEKTTIDGISSVWVKIHADGGKEGWCFAGYLTDSTVNQ